MVMKPSELTPLTALVSENLSLAGIADPTPETV